MINVYLYGMTIHRINLEDKCLKMLQYFCKGKTASVSIEYDVTLEEDSGGCYEYDGTIYIEAQNDLALAHELVHAVQLINGKLNLQKRMWKGKNYLHSKVEPWEQQAYGQERKILEEWLNVR